MQYINSNWHNIFFRWSSISILHLHQTFLCFVWFDKVRTSSIYFYYFTDCCDFYSERDVQVTQHPTKYVEYVFQVSIMHATCVDLRTDLIRIKSWYYQLFLFQIVFAIYMLMTTIILINLLIAMMSDTYQRIQV